MNRKGFTPIILLLVGALALIIGVSAIISLMKSKSASKPTNIIQNTTDNIPDSSLLDLSRYKNIINDGEIYLVNLGRLYTLDTTSMSVKEIKVDGLIMSSSSSINISHSGQYLFLDTFASGDISGQGRILIYDTVKATTSAVTKYIGPNARVEPDGVSSNDKYIIVTTSTAPGDSGRTVVSVPDGKVLKNLTGRATSWSHKDQKFAMSKGDITLNIPTGPQPTSNSVYIEDFTSGSLTESRLLSATNQTSYSPIKWIDEKNLIVEKDTYTKPIPDVSSTLSIEEQDPYIDVYNSPNVSFFKIDLSSGNQTPVSKPTIDTASYSPSRNWKIETKVENGYFINYISKIDGSQKIRFITGLNAAVWSPAK